MGVVLRSSPNHIPIILGVSDQEKQPNWTPTHLNGGGGAGTYLTSSRNKHKSWRPWRKTNWSIGVAASSASAHAAGATCASTSSDWTRARATWTTPKSKALAAQVARRSHHAGLWPLTTWRSSRSTSSRTESCFERFAPISGTRSIDRWLLSKFGNQIEVRFVTTCRDHEHSFRFALSCVEPQVLQSPEHADCLFELVRSCTPKSLKKSRYCAHLSL